MRDHRGKTVKHQYSPIKFDILFTQTDALILTCYDSGLCYRFLRMSMTVVSMKIHDL